MTNDAQAVFETSIVPLILRDPSPASGIPEVHFCGGPPGSGKSGIVRTVRNAVEVVRGTGVVEIVGDDMRALIPEYGRLLMVDDQLAADATDGITGQLVELTIAWSVEHHVHVVIEGTFRNFNVVARTASFYRENHYRPTCHLIAAHQFLSRFRIFARYCGALKIAEHGRYTTRAAHDRAYSVQEDVIGNFFDHQVFDEISIYDGNQKFIASCSGSPDEKDSFIALLKEMRTFSDGEATEILREIPRLERQLEAMGRKQALGDLKELKRDIEMSL